MRRPTCQDSSKDQGLRLGREAPQQVHGNKNKPAGHAVSAAGAAAATGTGASLHASEGAEEAVEAQAEGGVFAVTVARGWVRENMGRRQARRVRHLLLALAPLKRFAREAVVTPLQKLRGL